MYPICFPHEMLGYQRNDLGGIFLSLKIASKISKEEAGGSSAKGKQASRFSKWKRGS